MLPIFNLPTVLLRMKIKYKLEKHRLELKNYKLKIILWWSGRIRWWSSLKYNCRIRSLGSWILSHAFLVLKPSSKAISIKCRLKCNRLINKKKYMRSCWRFQFLKKDCSWGSGTWRMWWKTFWKFFTVGY